jgi:HNH endonuclease
VFFTIDHILPTSLGGTEDPQNLAYACTLCYRLKWHKQTVFDAVTQTETPIFHPRQHAWSNHFQWSADFEYIIGISAIGRATVEALRLNREKLVFYRKSVVGIGEHPPV